MLTQRIGFLGAGQMARALAQGFTSAGLAGGEQVAASDVSAEAGREFAQLVPGSRGGLSNREVVQQSDVIFLAVKPQVVKSVMAEVRSSIEASKLIVSIAAGIPLATLADGFGTTRVVRVMPNTPCLIGRSASAIAAGSQVSPDDIGLVERLLAAVGLTVRLDEKLIDAVTGLSGSGPAFVYLMIEALADGGVRMGLPRDTALSLAAQTVAGAAEMVLQTKEHPGVLKDRVASPGGTTIAGLQVLEERAVRGAMMAAVEAATKRSTELSKM
jgi:pyrroline-5-carboxylate reductase